MKNVTPFFHFLVTVRIVVGIFIYFLHYLRRLRRNSSTLCDLQSDGEGEGCGAAGQKKPPQKSNGGKMRTELDEYLTVSEATAQSGI